MEKQQCEHTWFDNVLDRTCICEKCGLNYSEFEAPQEKKGWDLEDFIKSTPIWYNALPKEYRDKGCIICGVIPKNIKEVAEKIAQVENEAYIKGYRDGLNQVQVVEEKTRKEEREKVLKKIKEIFSSYISMGMDIEAQDLKNIKE